MFLKNWKKENLKIKKIPIPIAFLFTILGLAGGVLLIKTGRSYFTKAEGEKSPQQIKITNIESNSFIVSWITNTEASGKVAFGENSSTQNIKNDIRDEGLAILNKYLTHFVVLENLKPKTKYYFKIISDDKQYSQSGNPFEVTTALERPVSESDIAQGKILTPEGNPAPDVLVYVSLPNSITQASLTEENGYWMILLSRTRSSDLQNYSNYDRNAQIEEVFVQSGKQTATASLTTGNDNPSPDIILGNTYDFVKPPNNPTSTPVIRPSDQSSAGFNTVNGNDVTIIYPSENEQVNSLLPEFFGTGPKEKVIDIVVESNEKIQDETEIGSTGQWKWTPGSPLLPGSHTITISYVDSEGFLKKAVRNFTVLAEGVSGLPSFTATPSGEITPSTTITPISPTPQTSLTPSASPTPRISPISLTSSPTPTTDTSRTTIPSGIPLKSGTSLPSWVFLSGGTVFILIGLGFLLL